MTVLDRANLVKALRSFGVPPPPWPPPPRWRPAAAAEEQTEFTVILTEVCCQQAERSRPSAIVATSLKEAGPR
jgi:hypothetical protein